MSSMLQFKMFSAGLIDVAFNAMKTPTAKVNLNVEAGKEYFIQCNEVGDMLISGVQLAMTVAPWMTQASLSELCKPLR